MFKQELLPSISASRKKNPDRFKAWVLIAGGKLDSPADYELDKKKVICDIHFTDKDRNRNNRLNFLAVPSLHLLGKSDEVGTSKKVLLAPEPVDEESSLATPKPSLTGMSDEVGTSKKVLLAPEPVVEESSLATPKPTLTDNCKNYYIRTQLLPTAEEGNT